MSIIAVHKIKCAMLHQGMKWQPPKVVVSNQNMIIFLQSTWFKQHDCRAFATKMTHQSQWRACNWENTRVSTNIMWQQLLMVITRQMFKHRGQAWAICNWSSEMPSLLRVITNRYMSSNWKTIVRACVKGVNMWWWMSWRCLKFSRHLRLANLDSHCSSVSLSLLAVLFPPPSESFLSFHLHVAVQQAIFGVVWYSML